MPIEISLDDFKKKYSVEFLIVTATSIEFETARKLLTSIDEEVFKTYDHNNTYYIGIFGCYICAICKSNSMGTISLGGSAQTVGDAIRSLSPKAVIMAGIAFGRTEEKQRLGDILVCKSLIMYEQSRFNNNGSIDSRGAKPEPNRTLLNRMTQDSEFQFEYEGVNTLCQVIAGGILSGEKLIDNPEEKNNLFERFSDAVGGEMEGTGVYTECASQSIPWILVKSICDWADGKKHKEHQPKSAFIALSFIEKNLSSEFAFSSLGIKPFKKKDNLEEEDDDEVILNAESILPLLIPRKDLNKVTDKIKEEKHPSRKIYFEYSYLNSKGKSEGYLFLGKNITISNSINHFKANYDLPDSLSIYVNKKYNKTSKKLIDRLKSIKKECEKQSIDHLLYDSIFYIEDTIWEATLSSDLDKASNIREDYVDQKIYNYSDENCLGNGKEILKKEILDNEKSNSIIIFGTGGVGKTTFTQTLKTEIENTTSNKAVFLIRGEMTSDLAKRNDIYIDSLLDLFDFFKEYSSFSELSKEDFKLNYICGNIIVIIDGLDEIDSALSGRFDMENFFNSLSELNSIFHNTKIILTSREYFQSNITKKIDSIDQYSLKGFTQSDIDDFKNIKLKTELQKANFSKILAENSFHSGDYALPVIINLVCQSVMHDSETFNISTKNSSKYLIYKNTYDSIIDYILNREIEKHKINCTVDNLFELLIEIVIIHKNNISETDLSEYVQIYFNDSPEKFKKSPLLSSRNNLYYIKEESVCSLVISRSLIHNLKNSEKIIENTPSILKNAFKGTGDLFKSITDEIDSKDPVIEENISKNLKNAINYYKKETNPIKKENIKKSISSLLYILFEGRKNDTKEDRTSLLKSVLDSKRSFESIHIYGEFYPLSFQDLMVINSTFDEYKKLNECHFGEMQDAVFSYCEFKNINPSSSGTLKSIFFESNCTFENSNINTLTLEKSEKSEIKKKKIKNNIISISKYIDLTKRSYNLIKRNTSVDWNKSHKGFLRELIDLGFLEIDKHEHYKIKKEFIDDLPDIKLNRFPNRLDFLIEKLMAS